VEKKIQIKLSPGTVAILDTVLQAFVQSLHVGVRLISEFVITFHGAASAHSVKHKSHRRRFFSVGSVVIRS